MSLPRLLPRAFRTLCAFLLVLAAPLAQAQKTIHVPADQPTIQGGINAASTGDTVLVAPGTYYENIDFKARPSRSRAREGPQAPPSTAASKRRS